MKIAVQILFSLILTLPLAGQDLNPGVPFAKLMSPAFATDYSEITVATQVRFVASDTNPGFPWGPKIEQETAGLAGFLAVPPGQNLPTGLSQNAPHVFVPKAAADILFDLKPGDTLYLTGHTCVGDADTPFVVFIADTVSRDSPTSAE
jgi:hypothetical protein